jgi:hypothetical protein
MKSHTALSGSSSGLAAITRLDTTVGFLLNRQEIIDLEPHVGLGSPGYVWRRVFQRRCA